MDNALNIIQDPDQPTHVAFIHNGRKLFNVPHELACEIARLTYQQAKKCEEYQNVNRIIAQDALLIRTGAPFSFTSNPRIREESFKQAQWDSAARKGMALRGVPSPKAVGTPSFVKSPRAIR